MSNHKIKFNINKLSSIEIVDDDTIFNLLSKICLEHNKTNENNITPDFLYVYDKDGPINFKYTNTDIKYDINDQTIDEIFYNNGKSYRQDVDDIDTKLIHSKLKKNTDLNYVCLLDILKEEEEDYTPEYYYGFIKKYWPNIKKEKSIKEYIKLSKSPENKKYIKNIETIEECNNNQIIKFIDNYPDNLTGNKKYTYVDIKNTGNTDINIIKLFYDLSAGKNVPFIKLVLNGYTDSFYKLYEEDIETNISREQYEQWIRGDYIYVKNFIRHKNYTNTLVIVIKVENEYVSLEISKNGDIHVIIKDKQGLDIYTNAINKYIKDNIEDNIYGKITNIDKKAINNDFEKIEIDLEYNKNKYDLINNEGIQDMFLYKSGIETFFRNNNTYVDLDDTNEDNNIIKIKYKRVDDYFKLDNIQEQIIKLYNDKIKGNEFIADMKEIKKDIKEVIVEQFMVEQVKAAEIVDDMLQDLNKKKKIDKYDNELFVPSGINPGADITLYLRPNNERVYFGVSNISSDYEMKNIIRFLDYFLSEYKKVIKGEVVQDFEKIDKCVNKLDKADIEAKRIAETTQDTILVRQDTVQLQRMPSLEATTEQGSDSDSDSDSDVEVFKGGAGTLNKRLKEKDKDLFSWKQKDYPNIPVNQQYSKLCQNSHDRLPVVVTNAELQNINESEELGSGRKSYGKVLKVGSTEEKKEENNYICPIYWDTRKNLSLDPNNLPENIEELIKNKDVIKRKHSYWRTAGNDVSKYVPIDTSKMETPWIHPKKYGMPCCFDTRIKEKKEKIVKEIKKSEIINYLKQFPEENFNNELPKKYKTTEINQDLERFLNNDISNDIVKYKEQIKKAIKKKDFKEYEKLLEKELKRIELIINDIDCKYIYKQKNTFGFNSIKFNGIFNLLVSIININYGNKIYDEEEIKGLINNVESYYTDNKAEILIPFNKVKNSIEEQIRIANEEKNLDKYNSENIYKINYIFLQYLLKKYNITDKEGESDYDNFIVLLDNRGFKSGKTVVEAVDENFNMIKIANKDIWKKTAYGLPSTINEPTDGKIVHKIFSKYIDKVKNIDGLPTSISVKKYMNDNFSKDMYFIFRELYEKWKGNENITKSIIEKTTEYTKDGKKGNEITDDILKKFKEKDFRDMLHAYFTYYYTFSEIMAKIYYGYDMKELRIDIQNLFINHKKYKRIKKLKEDLIKKLKDKKNTILYRKAGGGEIYNAFNINDKKSIENYIDYIDDDIDHDDKYILPVIMYLYKETNYVIFEEYNGSLKIRVPFDLFWGINEDDKFTLILKNTNEYSLLYYNRLEEEDRYKKAYEKGYADGYKGNEYAEEGYDPDGYGEGYNDGLKDPDRPAGAIDQSGGFNTTDKKWWDNIIKNKNYIINKGTDNTCSQKWLNEKIEKLYTDIEKIQNSYKDNIPDNIYLYEDLKSFKNKKYYINSNNKVSHIINDKNEFFPIYASGLNRIEDINKGNILYFKDLEPENSNISYKHIKDKNNGYKPIGYIDDGNIKNVLFENNTYIRIKDIPKDGEKDIIGYIDLFKLDDELGKNNNKERIPEDKIIKNIKAYYEFKDELLKNILNEKLVKPPDFDKLIITKDPDNIDNIYKSFDKTDQIKEHLYRFIDLLYKFGWPSYDKDNYLEYIYIEPSDLKDNIKEGELYFEYSDYEDIDAQTDKERKENSILNKYYNKKGKYYKSLKLYNDNKNDDYDY